MVALPEELDLRNAAQVAEALTTAVSRGSIVIIDMSTTTFCDCAGVRAIVRAHQRAADSGGELRLVVTARPVWRVFRLMGVDHLVEIYPSVGAARATRLAS